MKRFFRSPFLRNIEAGNLFEIFLVSAVASLLGIRAYLHLTNYPQIGSGDFHIAHMLWGGLLMLIGFILIIGFLSNHIRRLAVVVGGIGFGAFIDELGKFITSDNNYFYQPTIALIYIVFVLLFLLFRLFERYAKYTSYEYAANALEALEDVIFADFDAHEKKRALALLHHADQKNPLVLAMKKLVDEVETIPPPQKNIVNKVNASLTKLYTNLLAREHFVTVFIVVLILHCLFELGSAINGTLRVPGFAYGGQLLSAAVALVIVLSGAYLLMKNNRLLAFQVFKISLLVSILVTQFFLFLAEQLSAVVQLGISLVLLSVVQYFIVQELKIRRSK